MLLVEQQFWRAVSGKYSKSFALSDASIPDAATNKFGMHRLQSPPPGIAIPT